MEEHELKLAAEVAAITHMVDLLLRRSGLTREQAQMMREQMGRSWEAQSIPDAEPSVSDHLSAEVAEAIDAFWQRLLPHLPE
jgi:hypothetical protein